MAKFSSTLPHPTFPRVRPSEDPGQYGEVYPLLNVFDLMRVKNIGSVAAGALVTMRLATYVHPASESDVFRMIRGRERWGEDIAVRLTNVGYPRAKVAGSYPADRVFTGNVVSRGYHGASIVGLAHPERYGWASLGGLFEDEDMRTIAALKSVLGKVEPTEVPRLEEMHHRTGAFEIKKKDGKIVRLG